MNDSLLLLLAPEATLVAGACIVLLVGLGRSEAVRACAFLVSFLTVLAALSLSWSAGPLDRPIESFGIQLTNLGWYVRLIALGVGLVVLLIHHHMPQPEERSEVFSMILFSLAGILLTAAADDLVVLFLAIELVSVPTYVLVSIGRSNILAQEAGVKYFFLGALAAALMAYGFSFLYGASGTTTLSRMALDAGAAWVTVGMLLAFAGIAFKIAAVPFHAYVADVYQGAASPVTGLLGFFPKLAGFVALVKVLMIVQPHLAGSLGWRLSEPAFVFLWIVAAVTMTVGNVLALMQTNVKRILAYSSIAHAGYMMIGILSMTERGYAGAVYYAIAYLVMTYACFMVIMRISEDGHNLQIEELAGLHRRSPLLAMTLMLALFGLAGIPPTVGFTGKFLVFAAAVEKGYLALVVIGMINATISLYYYLNVIKAAYLLEASEPYPPVSVDSWTRYLSIVLVLAMIYLGVFPDQFVALTEATVRSLP